MKKVLLCLIFGLSACGGSDEPSGTIDEAQAAAAVAAVSDLHAGLVANDGNAAASGMFQAAGAAQLFIAKPETTATIVKKSEIVPLFGQDGTCECTEGSCTFTNCGGQGFTLNGTISRSGDTWTVELTALFGAMGFQYEWSFSGSITATETTCDGNLKGNGELEVQSEQGSGKITWTWELTFNDIVYDENGCATSGSLKGKVSYKIEGASEGNYSGSGEVTFDGSTCAS